MARHFRAAATAALLLSPVLPGPLLAQSAPLTIQIPHGQSVRDALRHAAIKAQIGRLRAQMPAGRAAELAGMKNPAPAITAGAVVSGTVTVGKPAPYPSLQFSYTAGRAGFAIAQFTFTSPNGQVSFSVTYTESSYSRGATVTFDTPFPAQYYLQPGQWVMTDAIIEDYAFNYTEYSQTQLAAIFATPYLTVVNNGPVDITPPVVTAGQILTPTVSLSSPDPTFEATLTGSDDMSGVANAYVIIEPPGGSFGQVNRVPVPIPTLSGTFHAYSSIFSFQPTGTWAITGYELCDIAGNCYSDTTPADVQALFGTTSFTVTN